MRVRGNLISLMGWRALNTANKQVDQSQQRIGSGLRVNGASDDAAGLTMGQNFMGQFKGLMQGSRNALDGISLLNTAEGAMHEIHTILQRLREMSLQAANGTLTKQDRGYLQEEANQLLREIDRISEATSFNGRTILNPSGRSGLMASVLEGLRNGWLEKAEQVINSVYNLFGDGTNITISFASGSSPDVSISGTSDINGRLKDLNLNLNLDKLEIGGSLDGGIAPYYTDRKIARVLTQAMLARNSDYTSSGPLGFPDWLKSGLGDYVAGGDDLVVDAIATAGSIANVVAAISTPWADDTLHRAAAYLAVKYLHVSSGIPMSMLMSELQGNPVDQAFLNAYGQTQDDFINNDFLPNGAAWAATLNLADPDVGGIGGGDAITVIPNSGTYNPNPLTSFTVVWPPSGGGSSEFTFQVGANAGETVRVEIPEVTRLSLGLVGVDLVNRPGEAITMFSTAVETLSSYRNQLGAVTNRLELAVTGNNSKAEMQLGSYSRIIDVDFAQELTHLTRGQILVQSSSAVLAQANTMRQHVMWLLKDLPFRGFKPSIST